MIVDPNNQNYVVLEQVKGISKVTGQPYVKITLVGVADRNDYVTYIDSSNHNQSNWFHITNNPTHGFVLNNLRVKKNKDKRLIDADSKPVILAEDTTKERIEAMLKQVWHEQDTRPVERFRELFE